MERIGVFGGTFDPVHFGHLETAAYVYRARGLDAVLFVPAGRPGYKMNAHTDAGTAADEKVRLKRCLTADDRVQADGGAVKKDSPAHTVTDAALRLDMLSAAVSDVPYFLIYDGEIRRPGISYTADTLKELKAANPDTVYELILGSDAFLKLPMWHEAETVLENAVIVCVMRPGDDAGMVKKTVRALKERFSEEAFCDIVLLPVSTPDISSGEIRRRVENGLDISDLVPVHVAAFIREHELYRRTGIEKR